MKVGKHLAVLLAAFATLLTVSAIGAAGASANPEFINSGNTEKTVLIKVKGGTATFRAVLGTVTCEDFIGHGFILTSSMSVTKLTLSFLGKCKLGSTSCTEPINTVSMDGVIGYINGTTKPVVQLLLPESGTTLATFSCGSTNITVSKEVVGEIPEINKAGVNQYNKLLTKYELKFESENKNSTKQRIKEIQLLSGLMTGVHLTENIFNAEASQEAIGEVEGAEAIEIKA